MPNDRLKRFLVFIWDQYNQHGGFDDFAGSFATLDEALAFAGRERAFWEARQHKTDYHRRLMTEKTMWHVFDMDERRVVADSHPDDLARDIDGIMARGFDFADESELRNL